MIDFFNSYGFWAWASLAAILLVAELLTGTMYLLWFGIAAGITALISFIAPGLPLSVDLLLFGALSIASVWGGKKLFPTNLAAKDNDINDPNSRLLGQPAIAAEDFQSGLGGVLVGDTRWRAICKTHSPKAGENLKITKVDGATLEVA